MLCIAFPELCPTFSIHLTIALLFKSSYLDSLQIRTPLHTVWPQSMAELIRDTAFGHFVRFVSHGKSLQFIEEKDPSLWKRYLDREQIGNMAAFGKTSLTSEELEQKDASPSPQHQCSDGLRADGNLISSSGETSQTRRGEKERRLGDNLHSTLTGQHIDSEKGRDASFVSWYGDKDPEVGIPICTCVICLQ